MARADLSGSGTAPTVSNGVGVGNGSGNGSNSACATTGCNIFEVLNPVASLNWNFLPACASTAKGCPYVSASQISADDQAYSEDVRSSESPPAVLGNQPQGGLSQWGYWVHELPGYPTGDDAVIGWNIEIWRQGEANPIFVRTVCNPSDAFAGNSAYNTLWLDCGATNPSPSNGEFSANGQEAGVLGIETAGERSQCESNLSSGGNGRRNAKGQIEYGPGAVAGATGDLIPNGKNTYGGDDTAETARPAQAPSGFFCYWEGPSEIGKYAYGSPYEISTGNTSQYNSKGPIKDEFATVGDSGLSSAGLQEAIYLQWSISKSSGQVSFSYAIDGVPNTYYTVDITAINWKDKELPVFTGNAYAVDNPAPSSAAITGYRKVAEAGLQQGEEANPGGVFPPVPSDAELEKDFSGSSNPQYLRVFQPNTPPHPSCTVPPPGCNDPPNCAGSPPACTTCPSSPPGCNSPPSCGGSPPTCIKGCPTCTSPAALPPTPTVNLTAQTPLQSRQQSTENVSLTLDTPLSGEQAIFPEYTILEHSTPQTPFNGADPTTATTCVVNGATVDSYCPNYILYDSDTGFREPAPLPTAIAPATADPFGFPQSAWLHQTPVLTTLSKNLGDLSSNDFNSTWLQGTLNNPCLQTQENYGGVFSSADGSLDKSATAQLAWPAKESVCTTDGSTPSTDLSTAATQEQNTLNVWDDYMSASVQWEDQFVSKVDDSASGGPTFGYIQGQLLRCDGIDSTTHPNASNQQFTDSTSQVAGSSESPCPQPFFGLSLTANATSTATQYAQGYVYANGYGTDHPDSAAVRVYLDTNVPATPPTSTAPGITDMAMWDRVSGTVVGNNPSSTPGLERSNASQPVQNTRSTYKELNFCEQGVASGLGIYENAKNPGKDGQTTASDVGDPNCEGYAVHWTYSNSAATCDVSTENAPAPTASTFPAPTADQPNASAQSIVAGWGVYGQEYSGSQTAYDFANSSAPWQPDAAERAAGFTNAMTPPYSGQRPGRSGSTNYFVQHCAKVVTGHWTTGHWQKQWAFTATPECSIDMLQENYTADNGAFQDGNYYNADTNTYGTLGELGTATEQQPSGAPGAAGTVCSGPTLANPSDTGSNSAYPGAQIPPPSGVASGRRPINYAVDEGSANGSGCPANTSTHDYANCNYSKSRPVNHRYVWESYALYKHKPTTDTVYTFGYWHYKWIWVWGPSTAGGTSDPYDCSTTITDVSQTAAASAPTEYAGPLLASKSYGTDDSHIVYDYSGTSEDPNQRGNDTAYKATNSALWEGAPPYSDSAPDVNGGAVGSYGSPAGSTGTNSWSCTVIRHNGWQTAGAWEVDPNLTSPTQSAGTFSDGTTAILPGSGWGANNSGPRLPNGQYNAQFTFSGLTATDIEAGNGSSCPEPTTEAASKLCWELAADYDGETDYVWSSETTENAPSSTSTAVISVYGPRDNR